MTLFSVVVPTRGDVDLSEIAEAYPAHCEIVIYDNGKGECLVRSEGLWRTVAKGLPDMSVYARYAAIEYATRDVILTQDDDCLLSAEGIHEIVQTWVDAQPEIGFIPADAEERNDFSVFRSAFPDVVVCNMPSHFREIDFYQEHALVGFGAAFHRDAPMKAFQRLVGWTNPKTGDGIWGLTPDLDGPGCMRLFERTCDIPFTFFTPRVLVDVPYQDMPWASADNRMWKQKDHIAERRRMLDLCLKVRDSA